MKLAQTIIGIVLLFFGGLWILQGANMIGGSAMSGQSQWLYIGILVAVIGVALLYLAYGRRRIG